VLNPLLSVTVLVTAGWFGEESDYRGRLFVLRIAPIGMVLSTALMIVVAKYQAYVGISLIFLAPIIKGVLAGEHIVFSAFQAYISDATTPQER
jgi:MFS family permease